MATNSVIWQVNKLIEAFKDTYDGKIKLKMPSFQRGVVMLQTKQSNLIRSLKLGYPIGSLLFYKKEMNQDGVEDNY